MDLTTNVNLIIPPPIVNATSWLGILSGHQYVFLKASSVRMMPFGSWAGCIDLINKWINAHLFVLR